MIDRMPDCDLDALLQEQRHGWEQGTPILVEGLLEQHTDLRGQNDALLDLINHEIVLRSEFETPPSRDEYLRRFPNLATDLAMLFDVHEAIEAQSADKLATVSAPQTPLTATADWPEIPNYEIVAVLGEGGMGIVYQALDRRLKRTVALKMIRGSGAGTEVRRRFQSEAEAVAKLDHPGIAHIYESGEYDKQPYFVMEYVDGGSLSSHLDGVPLAPIAAAHLAETLARSVHYAHKHGIIHRDLKPGNILLQKIGDSASQSGVSSSWTHNGTTYLPKIADFGLAKHVQGNSDATQTQAIVGTPSYMAPEQAGDFSRRIGPAADVYSLGAILYELLTGRPPFRGASVLDTLDQLRTQDPIPPTRLQPKVPRDLETICLKCLRKDSAQRYATSEELADDLGRFLRHEPILARPTGAVDQIRLWCKRKPALAAFYVSVFVSVFFIVFVGFPYVIYGWRQTLQEKEHSEAQVYDGKIERTQAYWRDNQIDQFRSSLLALRPTSGERDLRDFEWYYQWGLLDQELARVSATACVAYSPDGTLLAAGSKQDLHVWKTADLEKPNPQPVVTLRGHSNDIVRIAFSPHGDRLLSAAKDRTVRLWDVGQGKMVQMLPIHPAEVTAVAFHPLDGSIATASKDHVIRLWEPDGAKRLELDEHTGGVNDIAFSTDGRHLASASDDRSVILWDVATGDIIHRLHEHINEVRCVAMHGSLLASGGTDKAICWWDVKKGKLLHKTPMMPHWIQRLAFHPDGKLLAAACFDGTIQMWAAKPEGGHYPDEPMYLVRGHTARIWDLAFSRSGDRLASVSRDRDSTLRLWNPNRDQESTAYNLSTLGTSMALSPNRPVVAVAGIDKNVHLTNWRTGERKVLPGHAQSVNAVAFAGDGTLASASKDGKLRVWNVGQERMLEEFAGNGKPIVALEFHPDGHRLVTADTDGVVQFRDTADGRMLYQAPAHKGGVYDLAFSPDGQLLASAGDDGLILLSDSETGLELRRFHDPGRKPYALAFSDDGQFLASGDAAGDQESSIRIWKVRTGERIFKLEGHSGPVLAVAFSHNGRRLASAGGIGDGTVKLWDLTTGLEVLTLRGHGRAVSAVVFAPKDEAILSLGLTTTGQGQLRVWDSSAGRKR